MSAPVVNLVAREVSAAVGVRSVVSAQVKETKTITLSLPARRGPIGPRGEKGEPGSIRSDDLIVLDGGNF